jgi:hypothetical protein
MIFFQKKGVHISEKLVRREGACFSSISHST